VSELAPATDSPVNIELVIYERNQRRCVRLPDTGELSIGRSGDCDVRLDDGSISRRHVVLHMDSSEIEDLGTKNGTWLYEPRTGVDLEAVAEGTATGGVRLQPGVRHRVEPGSILKLAKVLVCFQPSIPALRTDPIPRQEAVPCEDVVLEDPEMMRLYDLAARSAATDLPILILGETGAGKDVLAEHIHRSSKRHAGPFMRVNCGALSASLLESELFGHQRGAFTGASDAKPGLLELAHGGTVFFDEIGELPLSTQVKFLHVLETGELTRVGGTRSKKIDVRYVAATNRILAAEVRNGSFRRDLYFRINGMCLRIAPLRKRPDEIEPLARYFLNRFCKQSNIPIPEISPAAWHHLKTYSWPGNVRELKNAMERAPLLCGMGTVQPVHLPSEGDLTESMRPPAPKKVSAWPDEVTTTTSFLDSVPASVAPQSEGDPSYQRIAEALRLCAGNQTRAAQMLGISRRTLVNRLNEYNLPRPRKRVS
jgi:two-component system, NtrC family, response regulator AtoC